MYQIRSSCSWVTECNVKSCKADKMQAISWIAAFIHSKRSFFCYASKSDIQIA